MPKLVLVRANQRTSFGREQAWNCINFVFLPEGNGSFLEILKNQANLWKSQSKCLRLFAVPKISLISKCPSGVRIRY